VITMPELPPSTLVLVRMWNRFKLGVSTFPFHCRNSARWSVLHRKSLYHVRNACFIELNGPHFSEPCSCRHLAKR